MVVAIYEGLRKATEASGIHHLAKHSLQLVKEYDNLFTLARIFNLPISIICVTQSKQFSFHRDLKSV